MQVEVVVALARKDRHVGVAVVDVRALVSQQLHDLDRRRLARVVDILLVS